MTQPPGAGPYGPADAQGGSQAPYGTPAPGGYAQVPPYPAAAYGPPPYYPKNGLAVWSLVLGIAAFALSCGLFTGIPAVIVGSYAKRAVAEGQADNGGMATAGVVLGWVAIGISVLGLVAVLAFFPAFFAFVDAIPDQP